MVHKSAKTCIHSVETGLTSDDKKRRRQKAIATCAVTVCNSNALRNFICPFYNVLSNTISMNLL